VTAVFGDAGFDPPGRRELVGSSQAKELPEEIS